MLQKLHIEYCKENGKYDVFVDDQYVGKHYYLKEALKNRFIEAELFRESQNEL